MASWTDERRRTGRIWRSVEDAMDSIGLHEQGTVTQGKAKSNTKAADSTDPRSRLGNEEEREDIAEHDASEKDCTKLSTGSFDELMLVEYYEDYGHSRGSYNANTGQE